MLFFLSINISYELKVIYYAKYKGTKITTIIKVSI